MAAFPALFCVVVCSSFTVSLACEGPDLQKIVGILKDITNWEELSGWLNVKSSVVDRIKENCLKQSGDLGTCYRMKLVKRYCEKTAHTPRQVADDMANVLETNMTNKLQADKLRKLKLTGSAGSPSADPTTHHSPSHSQKLPPQPTCEGPDLQKIVGVLKDITNWEELSGWLNVVGLLYWVSIGVGLLEGYWVSIGVGLALIAVIIYILYQIYTRAGPGPDHRRTPPRHEHSAEPEPGDETRRLQTPPQRTTELEPRHSPTPDEPAHDVDPPTLAKLTNELAYVVHKWEAIAVELELGDSVETISKDHKEAADCMRVMLSEWRNTMSCPYTWHTIVKALKSKAVNKTRLAKQIERKYMLKRN